MRFSGAIATTHPYHFKVIFGLKSVPELVIIRRPREDSRSKTGLGRYSDSVESFVESCNLQYEEIDAAIDLKGGFLSALSKGLIRPFFNVLKKCRSKDCIVHSTDELCGFFLPFVRGRRILTIHHVIRPGEDRGRLYYHLWFFITRIAIKSADCVIAVSPDTAEDVRLYFGRTEGVCTIFNSVSRIYVPIMSIVREDIIGVVAELIPRKNVSESIEAFQLLSEMEGMGGYRLLICGKGLCKDDLVSQIDRCGLSSKVEMVDSLEDDELVRFYNRAKLIFNTSKHEGVGMITLEAGRCGTPVLCLSNAQIPDIVKDVAVRCDGPEDMAVRAFNLITDAELYALESKRCIEKSRDFDNEFMSEMRRVYGL